MVGKKVESDERGGRKMLLAAHLLPCLHPLLPEPLQQNLRMITGAIEFAPNALIRSYVSYCTHDASRSTYQHGRMLV